MRSVTEWQAGDVARVNGTMAVRADDGQGWFTTRGRLSDPNVAYAYPRVVVDPVAITGPDETGEEGDPLVEIASCLRRLAEGDHEKSYRRRVAERLADLFDPRPAEPAGLGAVVEAINDNHFVRIDRGKKAWRRAGDTDPTMTCEWGEIAVVRVLSEGVPAEADR